MPRNSGGRKLWIRLLLRPWHFWVRIIAGALLVDQVVGTVSALPRSEAIVVACIGALFAPIPIQKQRDD